MRSVATRAVAYCKEPGCAMNVSVVLETSARDSRNAILMMSFDASTKLRRVFDTYRVLLGENRIVLKLLSYQRNDLDGRSIVMVGGE